MVWYRKQSSANKLTDEFLFMYDERSFIYSRNKDGPRTLPWGTPDFTGAISDLAPSTMTV